MGRRNMAGNVAKSVSTIDDAEMKGYFNTKKETIYKKIIWDIMNKEYLQGKNQKREEPRNRNKNNKQSADAEKEKKKKKRVEIAMEEEEKKKKQRLNSRINFDVLEKQDEEEGKEAGGRKIEIGREVSFGYVYGEEKNEREKSIAGSEENYGEENEEEEEDDYENAYYREEEDEERVHNNFDEDCDYEDY